MKVEVKKIDAHKREIKFEIPRERVATAFEEIYADISKVAKIKGFRPGKAPRHLIEAQHGKLAQEEVIKKIVPEAYHEAIHQEKLTPIDMPEIHDVLLKDGMMTFTAKLDLKPEFSVKDYKGITIKRKSSQVTDEEVNKTFEMLKQGQGEGKEVKIDDAFAHSLGYPNLDELKKILVRQMEMDKDRQNRIDVENQVVENLLNKFKFSVPPAFIDKQLERRVKEAKERLRKQGAKEEEIQKRDEEIRKELREAIEKDVKIYLIFDKIAEAEDIHVHENENLVMKVMSFLLKEAKWEEAK